MEMVTKDADAWISAAGLADLSDVPVPALSGGQAAHVALVRALATRPARLLLDEPLAAIDVARASAWRTVLHAVSKDRQTMLVTHNPTDIYALATSVIVIEGGKVAAQAPVEEILRVPPTQFVADLTGLNRITGTIPSVMSPAWQARMFLGILLFPGPRPWLFSHQRPRSFVCTARNKMGPDHRNPHGTIGLA